MESAPKHSSHSLVSHYDAVVDHSRSNERIDYELVLRHEKLIKRMALRLNDDVKECEAAYGMRWIEMSEMLNYVMVIQPKQA